MRNPLFLLDEVDKMGMDFRGDPSSALLEVLDPEQNHTFVDHYVEVEYDLSDVMFVATANTMNIPPAAARPDGSDPPVGLHRRREGQYRHALPAAQADEEPWAEGRRAGGLGKRASRHHSLLHARGRRARLEREISKICRKVVKALLLKKRGRRQGDRSTARNLDKYLGVRRYTYGMAEKKNQVGQVTGLAWTEVGGDLLTIEAVVLPGKGKTMTTGKLGEVMQESIAGRALGGAQPLEPARHRRRLLPEERHSHPLARRRDAEGRSERRHRHLHRDGVGAHAASRCARLSR